MAVKARRRGVGPDAAEHPDGERDREAWRRRWTRAATLDWIAVGIVLVPLVVTAVVSVDHLDEYLPAQDYALIELRTRDVGLHRVLTGLYSRDGWSHPGPMLFYALAVPYRAVGSSPFGLALGALLVNAVAIVGMAVVARRYGGTPLLVCTMLGCAVLVRALGADFVRDPWVCFVTVLPFGLAVLLAFAAFSGEAWALPALAAVASFAAQTHVGYVLLGVPLIAWGAIGVVLHARRTGTTSSLMRPALVSATVVVVLWAPPVADELLYRDGNLSKVFDWFRGAPDEMHSVAEGWRVVAAQFGWPPDWITGRKGAFGLDAQTTYLRSAPAPVLLLPFAAAVAVAWRRRWRSEARLMVTTILVLGIGVVAVARTVGGVFDYRLRWTWVLAAIAFVAAMWTAWGIVRVRWPEATGRVLVPVGLGSIAAVSALTVVDAVEAGTPQSHDTRVLRALVGPARTAVADGEGDVVVRAVSPAGAHYEPGVVLALERAGVSARVESDTKRRYGGHRVAGRRPPRAVLLIAGDDSINALARRRDLRVISYWGEAPPREAERWVRGLSSRATALEEARARDAIGKEEFTRRMASLLERRAAGAPVAIFLDERQAD